MNPIRTLLVAFSIALFSSACSDQGDERLAEKAQIEGQAQAKEQLKKDKELLEEQTKKQLELQDEQIRKEQASQRKLQDELLKKEKSAQIALQDEQIRKERNAIDRRSKDMEKGLAKRQDFYEDNSGHYEGTMSNGTDTFGIRVSLFPNIPKYSDKRVRTPAEVEADLTNLTYSAQIVQWVPGTDISAADGCRVENLRPNEKKGTLNIISSACPSSYYLALNRTSIAGTAQPSSNPEVFEIYADKKASVKAPAKKATPTLRKR